jgi:sulfite reductase beta subunit-like hemoprotein
MTDIAPDPGTRTSGHGHPRAPHEDPTTLGPARLEFADEKDVDTFVAKLEAFESGALTSDDWRTFRLLNGVYGQRQDGVMMIRAKLPGGILGPDRLLALAEVAERWGGGKGHVTTRQNVQFHFVPQADVEDALRILAKGGITTKEACGPSVRNWTCCPMAGVSAAEPFDVTPYTEAVAHYLLGGPFSASLPRKFKPSVGGCCGTDCSQAFINDLGLLARTRPSPATESPMRAHGAEAPAAPSRDGDIGFQLVAGGGLSTLRRNAITVDEFVPAGEVLEAVEAVIRAFHRIGNRKNRAKARLKWTIDAIGPAAFVAEYQVERAAIRAEGGRALVLPPQPQRRPDRTLAQAVAPRADFDAWAKDSVVAQKQPGYAAVVIRLVLGDITATQLRALARLAVDHGEGELRATNDQNLLLRWVPIGKLPVVHAALAELGLARTGARTVADVTSCPGASSCKIAVTQSRGLATLLTELFDRKPELIDRARDLTIKMSGCPNSCGQHHIAGLGFQGGVRKVDGRAVPQYLLHIGGGHLPDRARFARLVAKLPARRVPAAVERLIDLYVAERADGEAPNDYFARVEPEKVKATLADLERMTGEDATADDFIDLGETRAFEVTAGEGECAA